jgi:hypothetical protein
LAIEIAVRCLMEVIISRHIFGSIRGYTTLASSPDLKPEEVSALEILSFGQTNEESFLGSLRERPAFISRALNPGKWAVTRVFKGRPDDRNRTTLLFISAVITTDHWLRTLNGDVDKLLSCSGLWNWDGVKILRPLRVDVDTARDSIPPDVRDKVLCLLGAVEKYMCEENTTVVAKNADFSPSVLRALNMVLPVQSRRVFSYAVRSLNDGLPFTLISMADEGSFGNSKRKIINWNPKSSFDDCPYTESLSLFWKVGEQPPWPFLDRCQTLLVDLDLCNEEQPFPTEAIAARSPRTTETPKRDEAHKRRFSRRMTIILLSCFVFILIVSGVSFGIKRARFNAKKDSYVRMVQDFIARNPTDKTFSGEEKKRKSAIDECNQLQFDGGPLLSRSADPELRKITGELDAWLLWAEKVHGQYGRLDELLRKTKGLNTPDNYPDQNKLTIVTELEDSLGTTKEKFFTKVYVDGLHNAKQKVKSWLEHIGTLLNKKKTEVEQLLKTDLLNNQPAYYSDQLNEYLKEFKKSIEGVEADKSLVNGMKSTIEAHKKIADSVYLKLEDANSKCDKITANMNQFKIDASKFLEDANDLLNDPNIETDFARDFKTLKEAQNAIADANDKWPQRPELGEARIKFADLVRKNIDSFVINTSTELEGFQEMIKDPNKLTDVKKRMKEIRPRIKVAKDLAEESKDSVKLLKGLSKVEELMEDIEKEIKKPKE